MIWLILLDLTFSSSDDKVVFLYKNELYETPKAIDTVIQGVVKSSAISNFFDLNHLQSKLVDTKMSEVPEFSLVKENLREGLESQKKKVIMGEFIEGVMSSVEINYIN